MRRTIALFATLGWAVAMATGACQSLAGIEDRVYDPIEGGNGSTAACQSYCEDVLEACTGQYAVYSGMATCLGVCALLDAGNSLEPDGNSVACRHQQAKFAKSTQEPNVHCPRAGPGGDGVCGSNCEAYCDLLERSCPEVFALQSSCVEKCGALRDANKFDVVINHDDDTLQCRLVHVSSATVGPEEHCPHSALVPTDPCTDPAEDPPSCDDYCTVVMTACTGEFAVYESVEQCTSVCEVLEPGQNGHRIEDTVGCRRYHSFNSLADPGTHCAHAGPGGDGHCGDENCPAYCRTLAAACPGEFATSFAGGQTECRTACATLEGAARDSDYSVVSAPDGEFQCRLLHATRAFDDPSACASAIGQGACQ